MPISEHLRALRALVGTRLLVLPSVAVAVRDEAGRLLLVHDADTGRWVLPGGAVDPLETPADAAVREVWEETGLHVELTGLLRVDGGPECVVRYRNGDEVSYVVTIFSGRVLAGTPRADGEETVEVRYVPAAEIETLALPPWGARVLPALGAGAPPFRPPTWTPPTAG